MDNSKQVVRINGAHYSSAVQGNDIFWAQQIEKLRADGFSVEVNIDKKQNQINILAEKERETDADNRIKDLLEDLHKITDAVCCSQCTQPSS